MKESGHTWPLITEDEQERRMGCLVDAIRSSDDMRTESRAGGIEAYIAAHPEKELLAHVYTETARWLQRIAPEESDKYVMLAALNFVDCIAHVPMPASTAPGADSNDVRGAMARPRRRARRAARS